MEKETVSPVNGSKKMDRVQACGYLVVLSRSPPKQ